MNRFAARTGIVLLGLMLALFWPVSTVAQPLTDAEREALVGGMIARGGQRPRVDDLLRVIDVAAADGLPTGPLLNKAREGIAKNVAFPRIDPVVRRLAADLATADRLLRDLRPAADVDGRPAAVGALGEALSAGVTAAEVRELDRQLAGSGTASAGGLASAARGLALIKDARLPVAEATGVVAEAARRGFGGQELVDLGREVKRREVDYQTGRATLGALREAIARGDRPEQIFPPVRPEITERPTRPGAATDRPTRPEAVDTVRPTPVERPMTPDRPPRL